MQQAIQGPVGESEKLLAGLSTADAETKLSLLISGWARGVSAALEELAVAIDDLREQNMTAIPVRAVPSQAVEQTPPAATDKPLTEPESADLSEEHLIDAARKSTEETAEVRKESERIRADLEQ